MAERLLVQIATTPVVWGDRPISLTVSIGLAFATRSDHSVEQVIARADDALYRAKEGGRNRVVVDHRAEAARDALAMQS